MISLEIFESSYNQHQEQKLLAIMASTYKAKDKFLDEKNRIKDEFYDLIKNCKNEIVRCKSQLSLVDSERKKKIEDVNKKFKVLKYELDESFKLDVSEAKIHKKLIIAKIEANNKKYLDEFDREINLGDPSALTKKNNYIKYYADFKENKIKEESSILEDKLLKINESYQKNLLELEDKRKNELKVIDEEYLNISKQKELMQLAISDKEKKEKIKELSKIESDKNKIKLELSEYKKKLKDLKALRKEKIIENKPNVVKAYNNYIEVKKENDIKLKDLKKENTNYYNSLDEKKQSEYRELNKYVKQDIISIKRKRMDKFEKKIFKRINPAYIYAAPAFFGALVFTVLPFIFMLFAAWFKLDLTNLSNSTFVGFKNFVNIFTRDTEFQKALFNTVIYAFCTIVLLLIVTILMAAWLAKNTRIHNLVQTMVFTPHIASLVAISILWIAMLHPTGIINQFLALFGIKGPGWLVQENTSLLSVSFVTVWKDIGYYVLIIVAGLQGIPAYIYEAAKLDKSSRANTFFRLTLPLLVPTLSFVFVTKFISSFKVFAPIEIMTNGGPMGSSMVLSYWIYKVGRIGYNYGQAMAGAIILTIMIAVCTFFNYRFFKKQVTY